MRSTWTLAKAVKYGLQTLLPPWPAASSPGFVILRSVARRDLFDLYGVFLSLYTAAEEVAAAEGKEREAEEEEEKHLLLRNTFSQIRRLLTDQTRPGWSGCLLLGWKLSVALIKGRLHQRDEDLMKIFTYLKCRCQTAATLPSPTFYSISQLQIKPPSLIFVTVNMVFCTCKIKIFIYLFKVNVFLVSISCYGKKTKNSCVLPHSIKI